MTRKIREIVAYKSEDNQLYMSRDALSDWCCAYHNWLMDWFRYYDAKAERCHGAEMRRFKGLAQDAKAQAENALCAAFWCETATVYELNCTVLNLIAEGWM